MYVDSPDCTIYIGIASAILNTSSYSFVSLIYLDKEKLESAISMLEATSGIGLILGPIIGSSIYTAVGFKWTFVILGAVLIPLAIMINCCLISKMKHFDERNEQLLLQQEEEESLFEDPSINDIREREDEEDLDDDAPRVTNCDLIKDPRLVFACLCGALSYF